MSLKIALKAKIHEQFACLKTKKCDSVKATVNLGLEFQYIKMQIFHANQLFTNYKVKILHM